MRTSAASNELLSPPVGSSTLGAFGNSAHAVLPSRMKAESRMMLVSQGPASRESRPRDFLKCPNLAYFDLS